ncbi:MAG: FkbM family methyltransferase [Cyclobacteriaceae bacterium]
MTKGNLGRLVSIVNSFQRNGFIDTFKILFGFALVKKGVSNVITSYNNPKVLVRRNTSDLAVYRQIFMDGEYDLVSFSDPKVIIDAGANIGLFTLAMNQRYPKAQFYCIEPMGENFAMLSKNLEGIESKHLINGALWSDSEELSFKEDAMGQWGFRVERGGNDASISAFSMDDLMNQYRIEKIDILKIDIEGSEKEVFSKNTDWLNRVNVLVIEVHDYLLEGCAQNVFEAVGKFGDYKFSIAGENLVFDRR